MTSDMDEWLATLRGDGPPTELPVSGAETVAEAREAEWDLAAERLAAAWDLEPEGWQ